MRPSLTAPPHPPLLQRKSPWVLGAAVRASGFICVELASSFGVATLVYCLTVGVDGRPQTETVVRE